MATHTTPAERWWDRHEGLMWTVATAVEHWQWVVGLLLLMFFAVVS